LNLQSSDYKAGVLTSRPPSLDWLKMFNALHNRGIFMLYRMLRTMEHIPGISSTSASRRTVTSASIYWSALANRDCVVYVRI